MTLNKSRKFQFPAVVRPATPQWTDDTNPMADPWGCPIAPSLSSLHPNGTNSVGLSTILPTFPYSTYRTHRGPEASWGSHSLDLVPVTGHRLYFTFKIVGIPQPFRPLSARHSQPKMTSGSMRPTASGLQSCDLSAPKPS